MCRITSKSYDNERWNGGCRCVRSEKRSFSRLIENLEPGDYVMVHAGIAIAKITEEDEDEAEDLLEGLL